MTGADTPPLEVPPSAAPAPEATAAATSLSQVKVVKAFDDKAFDAYDGATASDKVQAVVNANKVVVFGKSWCPFCLEVRRTFDTLGVSYTLFNLDAMANGAEVQAALKALYKHTTVPYVFINKEFVGGCDATKAKQRDGELYRLLHQAGVDIGVQAQLSGTKEGVTRAPGTLFAFPEAVDDRNARLNGFSSFVVSLLVAIYWKRNAAHWVMVGLMVDFCLRFVGGSNISPLGSLSTVVVNIMDIFGSKPKWVAGPAKQFAAFCGLMFSALASFFYLMEVHESKLKIVGLSFTCALGLAAALEGFLGFCLGCWFFGLMVRFRLMPADAYATYTGARPEIEYTWHELNKRLNLPPPQVLVRHHNDEHPNQVDYKYKDKTDDHIKEDFHPVKHVKASHFLMHMGIIGLACCWKLASTYLNAPPAVWYAIGILSAILFWSWLVLYIVKIFMYPRKVHREWMHPLHGNGFAAIFICFVLLSFLEYDRPLDGDYGFANALFWIGAPTNLAISFVRVGDWVSNKFELEHINPAWMLMPVGNFVAAMIGPLINAKYRDAMQFWFAYAFMMWMVLFVITFYKAIVMPEYDDRARPALAAWVAAPAIGAVAYLMNYGLAIFMTQGPKRWNDFIFINMYWFSVSTAIVFLWCFVRPYFGRMRFDMPYWGAGFPANALSLVSTAYNFVRPGELSQGIAYALLAAASVINTVLFLQTCAALLKLRVFVPDYKWGPMSFMRLVHESFRGALPRLIDCVKALGDGTTEVPEGSIAELKSAWRLISLAHEEHSKHEDQVIFKAYKEFFPNLSAKWDQDHEDHHELIRRIDNMLQQLDGKAPGALAAELSAVFQSYGEELERHLRGEEDHLQGMPRKYIPLAMSRVIIRKCWEDVTPATTWFELLPWIVNNLPMLHQRVRFIKTLLWCMPERAQQVGIMLALGTDRVQWKRITDELPEIIPRGVAGWERYY